MVSLERKRYYWFTKYTRSDGVPRPCSQNSMPKPVPAFLGLAFFGLRIVKN